MAGDWIQIRTDLWDDPRIIRLVSAFCPADVRQHSERLRIRCQVLGALCRTWSLVDQFAVDGVLDGYTAETLDDSVGMPGWSSELERVGWIEARPDCLVIPEFERYFAESAKTRAKDRRRKRQARRPQVDRPTCVRDRTDKKRTREEKRREKKETPLVPQIEEAFDYEQLNTPEFREAWRSWLAYRGRQYKPLGQKAQIGRLAKLGAARAIAAIDYSMAQGWCGIYEEHHGADDDDPTARRRRLDKILEAKP